MLVIDPWRKGAEPTLSLEVFPARNAKAATKLGETLSELSALGPDFFSVTFGAGGSTRDGSRELVAKLRTDGHPVLAYVACYGLGPEELAQVLNDYHALGVRNVLAVRGDIPRDQPEFKPHPQSLAHASDFLSFARSRFEFCLGAAGYPEGHVEAQNPDQDLAFLKLKVDCGAQFIIANYTYDTLQFLRFRERCAVAGIQVPIVPGVMPIYSVKMTRTLASICGATIPAELQDQLARIPEEDKDAVGAFGIDYAIRQCQELLEAGVPGIHLYTMDRSASVVPVVRALRDRKLLSDRV